MNCYVINLLWVHNNIAVSTIEKGVTEYYRKRIADRQ
jgi:hypothetical protein